MTTNTTVTTNLTNAAAASGGVIGAITFWSLRGARMRRAELRAALEPLQLGMAMPKDPKPQALLRMAIEHARKVAPGTVFDRVAHNTAEIVYAVSARQTDEAAEVAQYQQRTRVRLHRASGALTLEDPADPVLQTVAQRYAELQEWITVTEVGSVLINALRGRRKDMGLCAVNLRGESGGVYFVPATNVDRLTALAAAMDVLGQQGALTVWPVPRGDRALAQAQQAAASDFGARLAEARQDLQQLLAEVDVADEGAQGRVLARAAAFQQLRTRVDLYAELLGDVRAELVAGIEEASAKLRGQVAAVLDDGAFDADDEDEDDAAA